MSEKDVVKLKLELLNHYETEYDSETVRLAEQSSPSLRITGTCFQRPDARLFKGLAELCGVYFRFPEGEDFSDVYWDDDYDKSMSVRTWFRQKYSGGNWDTFSVGDCYLDNRRKVQEFEAWVNRDERGKAIFGGKTFTDLQLIADIGMETEHLVERLEVRI